MNEGRNELPSRKKRKIKEGANKRTNEQLQAERVLWAAPKKKKKSFSFAEDVTGTELAPSLFVCLYAFLFIFLYVSVLWYPAWMSIFLNVFSDFISVFLLLFSSSCLSLCIRHPLYFSLTLSSFETLLKVVLRNSSRTTNLPSNKWTFYHIKVNTTCNFECSFWANCWI